VPWKKRTFAAPWTKPFIAAELPFEWLAYFLSNWTFLEVLEYLGRFSVLVAVVLFFSESGDRMKQKHYQAWQVVNTAQGKGGSGGRIEALQELNADGVDLVGVDASGAFLSGVVLKNARLGRANLSGSDLRNSNFESSDLSDADLASANFRDASLGQSKLKGVDLDEADLTGANLARASLDGASLANADLTNCDLDNIAWQKIENVRGANLYGIRNAPPGFLTWALRNGAVQTVPADQKPALQDFKGANAEHKK
jgi:uncharacterized protein YjbI with pentapeptide repeats